MSPRAAGKGNALWWLGLLTWTVALHAAVPPEDGSMFSIEILVRDEPVFLQAHLNHDSRFLAEAFCRQHNLTQEASEGGQACSSAVEAEILREYHRLFEATPSTNAESTGASFSHIRRQALLPPRLRYRPEIDDPQEVASRLEALYGSGPPLSVILQASHGLYVPVTMEGQGEVEWEGRGKMTLPGRFDLPAQAQRVCTYFQVEEDCPVPEIERLLHESQFKARLAIPPGPSLSLDLDLEWWGATHDGDAASRGHDNDGRHRRRRPSFVLYPGQDVVDAAIAFCARHQCPDRLNTIQQLVVSIKEHQAYGGSTITVPTSATTVTEDRVVVSMSTLPSRLPYVADRIAELKRQTRPPDHIYLCLPHWSLRERTSYKPFVPQALLDDPDVTVLWSGMDWGPATKLIPVLDVERDPRTMVVTVDDDITYPADSLAELINNSHRLPNAALGYLGFRLPRAEGVPLEHGHFRYTEGCNETSDRGREQGNQYPRQGSHVVDVLGGVGSVLYRVGFLDRARLSDYVHYPAAAFYVDDEWVSAALEEAGVPRVVLSRGNAPRSACPLMEGTNILPYAVEGSALNGPAHAHRNMEYQAMVLRHFREREGLWPTDKAIRTETEWTKRPIFVKEVFIPEYEALLGRRAASFRFIFEWLEGLEKDEYIIVETGTISDPLASRWSFSGQATLLFDRFINHYQGVLYSVDLDEDACRVARSLTSNRTKIIQGDSVQALWSLLGDEEEREGGVDVVYLDSYDVDAEALTSSSSTSSSHEDQASAEHHLKELAAILPHTRSFSKSGSGTLIVVDDNVQLPFTAGSWPEDQPRPMRGKGRLVQELLHRRCREVFRGWQVGWVCGGSKDEDGGGSRARM